VLYILALDKIVVCVPKFWQTVLLSVKDHTSTTRKRSQCDSLVVASCMTIVKHQLKPRIATIHQSLQGQVNIKVRTLVWISVATLVIDLYLDQFVKLHASCLLSLSYSHWFRLKPLMMFLENIKPYQSYVNFYILFFFLTNVNFYILKSTSMSKSKNQKLFLALNDLFQTVVIL
jgi:hypothetical protein